MCKSSLHPFIHQLPKIEHHIHLEGALTPVTLFSLASRNHITLPKDEDPAFESAATLQARYGQFTSLDDFLHYYYIGMSVLVQASDFEDLAMDYFRHAAADGVLHVEAFFDPQAHMTRGVSYTTVIAGFDAARKRAQTDFGITSELICCMLRHLPVQDCVATFREPDVQASFKNGTVIGIGLDSSELAFPPEMFESIYREANQLGLRRTAHAGEEGPSAYIRSALDVLGVERIDHGIRLAEDKVLMEGVARSNILLSVCPLSNVLLRCVTSVSELPIRQFLDAGVKFSINSDDPAYFGGYILANYCAVQDAFDLSIAEWERICSAAIEGSWCSNQRKNAMMQSLTDTVSVWQQKLG